jgi:hypothetical protein
MMKTFSHGWGQILALKETGADEYAFRGKTSYTTLGFLAKQRWDFSIP